MTSIYLPGRIADFWKGLDQKKRAIVVGIPIFLFIGIMALIEEDPMKDDVKKAGIAMCYVTAISPAKDRSTQGWEVKRIADKYPDGERRVRFMSSLREFNEMPNNALHRRQGSCESLSW